MSVLHAVRAFHLPLEPRGCRLRLEQILDQRGVEEASVGIFLHQDVDHLLGLVKTGGAGPVHALPRFLPRHRVQIHLYLQRWRED